MQIKILHEIDKFKVVKSIPLSLSALYFSKILREGIRVVLLPEQNAAAELYSSIKSFKPDISNLFFFPEWDCKPTYQISPSIDVQSKRLSVLFRTINHPQNTTIITSIPAITQLLPPEEYIFDFSEIITPGDELNIQDITLKFIASGYQRVELVQNYGTFSLKGNIIDIFSPSEAKPVRLELLGDIVEEMKFFEPNSQRSLAFIQKFSVTPVREISFSEKSINLFKRSLKTYCDDKSIRKDLRTQAIEFVENNTYFPGIEYYLPFFYDKLSTFFDYLPKNVEIVYIDDYLFDYDFIEKNKLQDSDVIPFPTDKLFINKDEFIKIINLRKNKSFYTVEFHEEDERDALSLKNIVQSHVPFKKSYDVYENIKNYHLENTQKGNTILYTCHTTAQAERLLFLLKKFTDNIQLDKTSSIEKLIDNISINNKPTICISDLSDGFILSRPGLSILTENEIFGEKKKNIKPTESIDAFLNVFQELRKNDYVVHCKHGIGIYRGLTRMTVEGIENDFFQIEYLDADLLFVPIYRLNTVQKYVSQGSSKVKLDKLGGTSWEKKKNRARKATMDLAHDLLKLQAERNSKRGYRFSPNDETFLKFETEFEFEETPHQLSSIKDVIEDMENVRPMDRLICGDVGFGKTEVALRSTFKAVSNNKQVALLVPTTILAFQHYGLFTKRFANYPFHVELLTRFKTRGEQYKIIEKLKSGEIDIVIGTHRLLSSDVEFYDLGLLIIDEEQRFGVKHKERIKEISTNIDILTLTATPIPRTLNMSLIGLKDISIIATPPINRLPIKTFISKFNDELIRRSILFELERGGQVFFLHNRVQDLPELLERISNIVPEARTVVAHGQMKERELEERMLSFYNREADVLLCTTIIESGLDIPNTNTIIINRADMFGLSQLYQIRGRVGRSTEQAYCYLFIPSHFTTAKSAIERIKILQRFTDLGSGFNIASYDLEFRGAGELLGSSQSGFIEDIGLEEYLRLLEESVDNIKGIEKEEDIEPEIAINTPAFIPESYIKHITQRLYFYKKLSNSKTQSSLDEIEEELVDRYGHIPEEVENLFRIIKIKQYLKPLKVSSVKIGNNKLVYTFDESTDITGERIISLVTKMPEKFKITPRGKFISNIDDNKWRSVIKDIEYFIHLIGEGL